MCTNKQPFRLSAVCSGRWSHSRVGLQLIPTKDFRKGNQWLTKDLEKPGMRCRGSQEAPEEEMKDCWEYLPDRHLSEHWAEVLPRGPGN